MACFIEQSVALAKSNVLNTNDFFLHLYVKLNLKCLIYKHEQHKFLDFTFYVISENIECTFWFSTKAAHHYLPCHIMFCNFDQIFL
jgi:hypothetical protein